MLSKASSPSSPVWEGGRGGGGGEGRAARRRRDSSLTVHRTTLPCRLVRVSWLVLVFHISQSIL